MFDIIVSLIIMGLYSLFIYAILSKLLEFKRFKLAKPLYFIGLWLFSGATIHPEEMTGCMATLFAFSLLTILCCKNDFLTKLSTVLIFYPLIITINFMTEDIGLEIWLYMFQKDMSSQAQGILHIATMLLRIIIWYFIYLLTKNWLSQFTRYFTKKMWLVIDAISMAYFIGIITIVYNSKAGYAYLAYPACIACIISSLGICYLCVYISQTIYDAMEIQNLKYQQAYYEELEHNQQNIRKLRHDMLNHLNIVTTLLHTKETDQASSYLAELTEEFVIDSKTFCQNSIINAVLNAKYALALKYNIHCLFQVELNNDLYLSDVSLCCIITNTLDNAIEACKQIPDSSARRISLKSRCMNGFFSYEITNAKQNHIIEKNGIIQTQKGDKSLHGFGLQNIRDMVLLFHGDIDVSYTDDAFTVTIVIPLVFAK